MKLSRTTVGLLAAGVGGAALLGLRELRTRSFDLHGKVAMITGGSRGLGLVLAREYARRGANLVLIARDPAELARAARDLAQRSGVETIALACDVGDEAQVADAVRRAVARFGRVDVLVNNAGEIEVGPFETMNTVDWERAMSTNFWGALHAINAVVPYMRIHGEGRIVNISSIGGVVAVPHLLPYCASKFALTGLSFGLQAQLAKNNILVTTVCPSLMRTGSPPNAFFKGDRDAEYAWFATSDAIPVVSMHADRAARRIVRASLRGDARLLLGPQAKLAGLAQALAPRLMTAIMAMVNRALPESSDKSEPRPGRESEAGSARMPRWIKDIEQRAARKNNELPADAAR